MNRMKDHTELEEAPIYVVFVQCVTISIVTFIFGVAWTSLGIYMMISGSILAGLFGVLIILMSVGGFWISWHYIIKLIRKLSGRSS